MPKDKVDPCLVLKDFLKAAAKIRADIPIYVGIDPGSEGAIAFLCGRLHAAVDIPTMKVEVKRQRNENRVAKAIKRIKDPAKRAAKMRLLAEGKVTKTFIGSTTKFDLTGICDLFRVLRDVKERAIIVLEQVPVSTGPGRLHGDVMANRAYAMWPLFLHYNSYRYEEVRPVDWKMRMGLKGKKKKDSLLKARAMFPRADLRLAENHDRAEALLMCEYVRRLHAGRSL